MKNENDIGTQDVVKFLKDKKFVKTVEYFRTQPIFNILGAITSLIMAIDS